MFVQFSVTDGMCRLNIVFVAVSLNSLFIIKLALWIITAIQMQCTEKAESFDEISFVFRHRFLVKSLDLNLHWHISSKCSNVFETKNEPQIRNVFIFAFIFEKRSIYSSSVFRVTYFVAFLTKLWAISAAQQGILIMVSQRQLAVKRKLSITLMSESEWPSICVHRSSFLC